MSRVANFSKTGQTLSAVCVASFGLFCQQVYADPIEGGIAFGGKVKFNAKSLAKAADVQAWKNPFVMSDSGDFAAFVHQGDAVTLSVPWAFNGTTPPPSPWNAGGFTFDLVSWSIASQSAKLLDITGSGMISGNGFDLTPGTWTFTTSKRRLGTSSQFSFQATAVPEPSAVLLMLGGCASFIGARRIFHRRSWQHTVGSDQF